MFRKMSTNTYCLVHNQAVSVTCQHKVLVQQDIYWFLTSYQSCYAPAGGKTPCQEFTSGRDMEIMTTLLSTCRTSWYCKKNRFSLPQVATCCDKGALFCILAIQSVKPQVVSSIMGVSDSRDTQHRDKMKCRKFLRAHSLLESRL